MTSFLDEPHHDGSVTCSAPGAHRLGDTVPVRVRVPSVPGRAGRDAGVVLRSVRDGEPTFRAARVDGSDETGAWFVADLPVDNPVMSYRFLLDPDRDYRWLTARGVVTSWGPQLSPEALGHPVTAFLTLEIHQAGAERAHDAVGSHLADIPEVLEVHTTTGAGDLLARVVARSNDDLQRVIDAVLAHPLITRSSTVIALATQVPHRVLPLARASVANG